MDDRYPSILLRNIEDDAEELVSAQMLADVKIRTAFENLIYLIESTIQPLTHEDNVDTLVTELRDLMFFESEENLYQLATEKLNGGP